MSNYVPNPFRHIVPDDQQRIKMEYLRNQFYMLHSIIKDVAPDCRERSVALTNLEQAAMWANKAITHGETRE